MEVDTPNRGGRDTAHGKCRWCFTKGQHRFLQKEYLCYGFKEVYYDIVVECFNLTLSTDSTASKLVCLTCVEKLREALSFRDMVVKAEDRLLDPLRKGASEFVHVGEVTLEDLGMKNEEIKMEMDDYTSDTEDPYYLDLDNDNQNTPDTASEGDSREAALIARYKPDELKLPKTVPQDFARYLARFRGKIITAADVALVLEETERHQEFDSNDYVSEKRALVSNITTILQNSNVLPFKRKSCTYKGFLCFFCRTPVEDVEALRSHNVIHKKENLERILWRNGSESLVVYIDVTDLKCTICNTTLLNLKELKTHLTKQHKKKFHTKCTDRLIPFQICQEEFTCQVCEGSFETFGSIERHMNGHYRNYVCKECGAGFVTNYRLKVHLKSHIGGSHPCELCKKVFNSIQKKKNHINSVHRTVKRFKCPTCGERFSEYFARQKHMVNAHNAVPLKYNCKVCEKVFDRRYALSRHLKKAHLEERNQQCEYCPYSCFTTSELRMHMIKHVGDRIHECSVCKKSYARKKTLREHMRIHSNDRRHACEVCGQAFIQKCSLKGHMRTHHPEFTLE